jgi:hypothetical protein
MNAMGGYGKRYNRLSYADDYVGVKPVEDDDG